MFAGVSQALPLQEKNVYRQHVGLLFSVHHRRAIEDMIQRQEQATGADKNFTVFYGFPWWTPNNGVLPSEAQPLVKELIQDNFKKDRWYAAFRCLSPELASKEALLAIAEGRYAETIGEEFWEFFSAYSPKGCRHKCSSTIQASNM